MVEKIKKRRKLKNRDKSKDYVDGPSLQRALVEWYESGEDEIPKTIQEAIFGKIGIIERLGTSGNFRNYSYLDSMKSDAALACLVALNLKKYRLSYENPFAYFTQVSYNAFIQRINAEKKENYVKHKNGIYIQHELELGGEITSVEVDESSDAIIKDFEDKIKQKKTKNKKKNTEMDQFYE